MCSNIPLCISLTEEVQQNSRLHIELCQKQVMITKSGKMCEKNCLKSEERQENCDPKKKPEKWQMKNWSLQGKSEGLASNGVLC